MSTNNNINEDNNLDNKNPNDVEIPQSTIVAAAVTCNQCETAESFMWHRLNTNDKQNQNKQICNSCWNENNRSLDSKGNEMDSTTIDLTDLDGHEKKLRKSTRSTRYKPKTQITQGPKAIPKGKGRRCIFKKQPMKSPFVTATTTFVKNLFYKGMYMQVGDIVSLLDDFDDIFYAQVRGFLVDSYCEKSAFITWLIPTKASPSPNDRFDPSTYLIGPDEDYSRKLSCMEFVMHAPSDYYYNKSTPYPPPFNQIENLQNNCGYLWTRLSNKI